MRRPPPVRRIVTAVLMVSLAVVASGQPVSATHSSTRPRISNAGCDAFADYFTIEFLVAFAAAFAGLGEELGGTTEQGSGRPVTKEDIQDVFHLIFSPKLEDVTGTLAREAPRSIRSLFAKQQAVFARGVEKLEALGLTKKQIQVLAQLNLTADTDIKELLGDVDIPKARITAAARDFGKDADALDLNDVVTKSQQAAFQRTGSTCGVFPISDVDCESLVGTDLTSRLVGGVATVTNDDGSCVYAGPKDPGSDAPAMVIDVYKTRRSFARLVEQLQGTGEEVDADTHLGDGFSTFASTKTCGKTLYARTTDATLVIAVCAPNDGDVATDDLLAVRDEVVAGRSILDRKSG
jgi:hypothetical protein